MVTHSFHHAIVVPNSYFETKDNKAASFGQVEFDMTIAQRLK